jgi:hypothetical protein
MVFASKATAGATNNAGRPQLMAAASKLKS